MHISFKEWAALKSLFLFFFFVSHKNLLMCFWLFPFLICQNPTQNWKVILINTYFSFNIPNPSVIQTLIRQNNFLSCILASVTPVLSPLLLLCLQCSTFLCRICLAWGHWQYCSQGKKKNSQQQIFFNEKRYQNVFTSFPFSNYVSLVLRELCLHILRSLCRCSDRKKKPGVRW